MKRYWVLLAVVALALSACGSEEPAGSNGGNDSTATPADDDSGDAGGSGNVVDKQPPGMGVAKVDGLEYSFDTPNPSLACEVSAEQFSFAYIIGDNEVGLAGGASITGGQWFGSMTLRVSGDDGATEYSAKVVDNPEAVAIDGNSVSYSGPMEKLPPSSGGSQPDPVDVGNGVFSATC